MRSIVLAVLGLSCFGVAAYAADLGPYRNDQRIRIVEQVPYCGDCEAPIARSHSPNLRPVYVGYPVWQRGCALGGCYGYYDVAPSCYWRDVVLPASHGGRVRGVEEICDFP
jgi:hypothetical protein